MIDLACGSFLKVITHNRDPGAVLDPQEDEEDHVTLLRNINFRLGGFRYGCISTTHHDSSMGSPFFLLGGGEVGGSSNMLTSPSREQT